MCPNKRPGGGIIAIIGILILSCLIFYQIIITLFLPLRINLFILLVEISVLFFLFFRIIWPY